MIQLPDKVKDDIYQAIEFFKTYRPFITKEGIILKGFIQTNNKTVYKNRIELMRRYPYVPPRSFIEAPKILNAPHMYGRGRLCLFEDSMWNPGIHNIKNIIEETAVWLNKYETWCYTKSWPGLDAHSPKKKGKPPVNHLQYKLLFII